MFGYFEKPTKANGSARAGHHIITIDVEDWPQSTLDHNLPIGDQVVANTHAFLELLNEAGAQATFFVYGQVAQKHPELARQIVKAGHEVATHGYSHEPVELMSAKQFREQLHKAIDILQWQTGEPVYGHRAAGFAISARRLYFLEYLGENGLIYDSSVFPIRHPRYGIPGAYPYPHFITCASRQMLMEFPPATMKLSRIPLTGVGGAYFRVLPYWCTKFTLHSFERAQNPATCYFKVYEIDVRGIAPKLNSMLAASHLSPSLKCAPILPKLRRLLSEFRFMTMGEACQKLASERVPVALDLAVLPIRYGKIPVMFGA